MTKVMVTISVERGGNWTERTLTLKGEEEWARSRWPEVFPSLLDRALKGALTEADAEEPDEEEAPQ
jgi:hypothetical protein